MAVKDFLIENISNMHNSFGESCPIEVGTYLEGCSVDFCRSNNTVNCGLLDKVGDVNVEYC